MGFEAAVREYILQLLGITFQRIHKKVLGSYLNLEGTALDALVGGCAMQAIFHQGATVACCMIHLVENEAHLSPNFLLLPLPTQIKEKAAAANWMVLSSPSGDLVQLPKNVNNQHTVTKRTQEVIRLEQVAPVLRATTVGFY